MPPYFLKFRDPRQIEQAMIFRLRDVDFAHALCLAKSRLIENPGWVLTSHYFRQLETPGWLYSTDQPAKMWPTY